MMYRSVVLGAVLLAVACGGSQRRKIKSQDELLDEQMALAEEQTEKEAENNQRFDESESDSEKAEKFDMSHAEHELKRATINASDCPNTFEKGQIPEYKPGTAIVNLTFTNDGAVKEATLNPEYADTTVGTCVLRAMNSVRVKIYTGPEQQMEWKVELGEAKPPETGPKKTETPKK